MTLSRIDFGPPVSSSVRTWPIIAIGASTGGIDALMEVLGNFPVDCPPTVIVQHIRSEFAESFCRRLDRNCRPQIALAQNGAPLVPGRVYLAPGNANHLVVRGGRNTVCHFVDAPPVSGHRPSIDVLFQSVADLPSNRVLAIGVLLTGMGRDGAKGLLAIRKRNGVTIAQDADTSVVHGMPKAAFEIGATQQVLPIDRIAAAIFQAISR